MAPPSDWEILEVMNPQALLGLLILAIFIGIFAPNSSEIDDKRYAKLAAVAPAHHHLIKPAMADGKVTWEEYNDLSGPLGLDVSSKELLRARLP